MNRPDPLPGGSQSLGINWWRRVCATARRRDYFSTSFAKSGEPIISLMVSCTAGVNASAVALQAVIASKPLLNLYTVRTSAVAPSESSSLRPIIHSPLVNPSIELKLISLTSPVREMSEPYASASCNSELIASPINSGIDFQSAGSISPINRQPALKEADCRRLVT